MNASTIKACSVLLAWSFLGSTLMAQDVPGTVFRYEVSASWLGLTPHGNVLTNSNRVDFSSDLGINHMQSQVAFQLLIMPWYRQGLFFEVIPYRFDGEVTPTSSFRFGGVTYLANEPLSSKAALNFIAAGYRRNMIQGERLDLGFLAGAAYLGVRAQANSVSAGSSEVKRDLPFPLVGLSTRFTPANSRFSFRGESRGMTFGSYGWYFDATGSVGFKISPHVSLEGGYMFVDGDGHHNTRGAQLNFHGPTVTLRFHD
jgi:hypothetical protein